MIHFQPRRRATRSLRAASGSAASFAACRSRRCFRRDRSDLKLSRARAPRFRSRFEGPWVSGCTPCRDARAAPAQRTWLDAIRGRSEVVCGPRPVPATARGAGGARVLGTTWQVNDRLSPQHTHGWQTCPRQMLPFGFPAQSELDRHSTQKPAAVSQSGVEIVAEHSPVVVHVGTQRFVSGLQVLPGAAQSVATRHSTHVCHRVLHRGNPTLDSH